MGQAKQRKIEIAALKAQAKEDVKSFTDRVDPNLDLIRFEVEMTGASKGYHNWAAPRMAYRLDSGSNALRSIREASVDTMQAIPTLTKDSAYLLAAVNYIVQGMANGITQHKDKGAVFAIASEILRRGIEPVCSDIGRIEVHMTTVPSPMAIFGMKGDKFIPGFADEDYIRVYNRKNEIVLNWSHKEITSGLNAEDITNEMLAKLVSRAMA
jgi:hypothetical protein